MMCEACGTPKVSKHGTYQNKKGLYQRWKCNTCGITWTGEFRVRENATPSSMIRIKDTTKTRLINLQYEGESFDTVINRALDSTYEAKQRTREEK